MLKESEWLTINNVLLELYAQENLEQLTNKLMRIIRILIPYTKGFLLLLDAEEHVDRENSVFFGMSDEEIRRYLHTFYEKDYMRYVSDMAQETTVYRDTDIIDNNIRLAVSHGLDPITAICMATINAANCYNMPDRGSVAPGRRADLILFEDLDDFRVRHVWVAGKLVAAHGTYLAQDPHVKPEGVSGRMNVRNFSPQRLALPLRSDLARTIRIIPGSVVTEEGRVRVKRDQDGCWVRDEQDVVKIAVVERHKGTGCIGLGLLEGYGLKNGAVATSVAHDSHNIIVAGDNNADMAIAVRQLVEMGGGMAIVHQGRLLGSLPHEIAGLMTDRPGEEVAHRLEELGSIACEVLGVHESVDPFMTLCFMALPVIPKLKITDTGLFDVNAFCTVPVEADD